ncbi:uncharacterized protein [Euwallacea similis]|uniref:uncharacterized protein isoform X2 n=1 Tax=Euwallacea similis TaxID=1736056 RepID=UPI003450961A
MTKMDDIVATWKKLQLAKLKKMPYRCTLKTPDATIAQAILEIITTQEERRLEISSVEGTTKCTLLFDKLNGFTPNLHQGTILLGYGEENKHYILSFTTQISYTSVLNELNIFLREIANVPTPPSSDSSGSSDTSTSSNEEV